MRQKRFAALVLAGLLAIGSLAGCSSDSSSSSEEESVGWESGTTVYVDVPSKAGGGTDLITRYLTQALTETNDGVNFVVTNYETAEVGMENTKNADADGLTIVTCSGNVVSYLTGASDVNIMEDLRVVGVLSAGGPQAIIASPDAPYSNLEELAEYILENPGDLVIGCSLGGTTQILFTALIEAMVEDTSLVNFVQCPTEADKLTNVAAGSVDIANCSISNAQSYAEDGKLKVLGTIGPSVSTLENMSDLTGTELDESFATTVEQGVDVTWDSYFYVLAPKDLSDEWAEYINAAICEAAEQDSFVEGLYAMASYPSVLDLEESVAALEEEWETQEALITSMGLNIRE